MKNKLKNNKGITLVALVVTIVVILILAGVSINLGMGDNGIIRKAQEEKNTIQKDIEQAEIGKNKLLNELKGEMSNNLPDIQGDVQVGQIVTGSNKTYIDLNGNKAVIPVGFKVLPECSDISKGLVIEDESQNQYVWIPVGRVKKSSTETVDIQLGRYTFNTTNGTPTLVQPASEFRDETTVINSFFNARFKELPSDTTTAHENVIPKDLADFIASVGKNGGYYIGRYEAGCNNVRNSLNDSIEGVKVLEQRGKPVYNYVTQQQAATLCQNLYSTVNSDLMNSYAWDTAIEYIQKMGNSNYANANNNTTGNNTLMNTGKTGDVKCNVYDMAANIGEWTTETSSYTGSDAPYTCCLRGGVYINNFYHTGDRTPGFSDIGDNDAGFRPVLYIK